MTTAWRLSGLGLVGLWVFAVWAWFELPAEIALPLDSDGGAGAGSTRSVLRWYFAPLLATVLMVSMTWLGRWLPRYPRWVNLPGKERVLALPEEYHGPFNRLLLEMFGWISIEMVLILGLVQLSMYREALGLSTEGVLVAIIGIAVLSSPILLAMISLRTQKVVDEAVTRARADGVLAE